MTERAVADDTQKTIPDRTPPTARRQSHTRVQQLCVICAAPYLVAPAVARSYQTCSQACSTRLRRRSQRGPRTTLRARRAVLGDGDGAAVRPTPQEPAEERADIIPVGRGSVDVLCAHCNGLRGRWSARELPPPGLCWRCLWRRNAGLEPGIPLG